jgi:hypothetical protein
VLQFKDIIGIVFTQSFEWVEVREEYSTAGQWARLDLEPQFPLDGWCLTLFDRAPRRYNGFSGPSLQKLEAAMFTFTAGILLAILLVFVVIPLIVVASVRLFLSILDYGRKVPPHTLRRIH